MNPQRPTENNFKQLLANNDIADGNSNHDENSDAETPKISSKNIPILFDPDSCHDDQSSVSSSSDIVPTDGHSVSTPNLAQHPSPARYAIAYELSSIEGNF